MAQSSQAKNSSGFLFTKHSSCCYKFFFLNSIPEFLKYWFLKSLTVFASLFIASMAASALQWQSWVFATVLLAKTETFTVWCLR